jgi:squalene synthase HpnC
VYAFARGADDIADEGVEPADVRKGQLQAWRRRLHDAIASSSDGRGATGDELIFVALAHTIRTLKLPTSLFDDLVSAFDQDTRKTRYSSWSELLEYCSRSANPVGRLVLRIAGHADEALDRSSDALCTALQLTNFWQDFGRDWRAGRLYVPREVHEACKASEDDLAGGRMTHAWVQALGSCTNVTRQRFRDGRDVCDAVRGRLGLELRFTWLGGYRILRRVEHRLVDLLSHRPDLGARDVPALLWQAAMWRRGAE